MDHKIVFMFSGQGSQYYGMGRELYRQHSGFRNWMLILDGAYVKLTGKSVLDRLYSDRHKPGETFDELAITHPAIFMVEYALAQALIESGICPDCVLGSSLGEFAAGAVAGVADWEELLQSVAIQAEIVRAECQPGGMLAVLDDSGLYEGESVFYRNSELAAVNFDRHFVVAGRVEGLDKIEQFLKSNNRVYLRLPVQYAFHSSLIEPAAERYQDYLKTKLFRKPKMDYISGWCGERMGELQGNYYWDLIRKPMEFRKGLKSIGNNRDYTYIDLSPSGTMAAFAKQVLGSVNHNGIYPVMTMFNQDVKNLETITQCLTGHQKLKPFANRPPATGV